MDGRSFQKCIRDCALFDDWFTPADADLVFVKCKGRSARKIDFFAFTRALREVAKRREISFDQVEYIVCTVGGIEIPQADSDEAEESVGPERFFYDTSLYTGTHRNGGPSLVGSGLDNEKVSFEQLVNRDKANELGRLLNLSLSSTSSRSDKTRWLGRHGQGQKKAAAAVRGPERFYYDKSTYTGTHRNGGPDVNGNGLKKEGYADLSELVLRDVIQDDDLNRRRRSAALEEFDDVSSPDEGDFQPSPAWAEPAAAPAPLPRLLGAQMPVSAEGKVPTAIKAPQAWYGSAAPVVLTPKPTPRERFQLVQQPPAF